MSESVAAPEPTERHQPDLARLAVVLVLALVVRSWVVVHAEVPARDGVGFIRIALQFEEKPWAEVVRRFEQHPVYPLAVLAMSEPVRLVTGGVTPDAMVRSAQLVSLFAGVLMVVPIYFLGKSLFGRNAGTLAAAFLQCLPVFVHVTSDALSESHFLLFVSSSLLFGVRAVRAPVAWRFFLSGFWAGLAYLTRPEGLELVVANGLVLLAVGLTNWGVKATAVRAGALAAGVLPLVGLYVGITGHLTNKPTPNDVINGRASDLAQQASGGSRVVFAAFWDPHVQTGQSRALWALKSLAAETAKSSHYAVGALAILGLWWYRRKLRVDAALWVPLVYAGMQAALLWRMAVVIGYVSERHTLPIVLAGSFWAAAVVLKIGAWVGSRWRVAGRWLPAAALAFVTLSGLPPMLKPLHANRAGHHAAGRWIAARITDRDEVVDPFCWAHYYAGRVFLEGKDNPVLPHARVRYVVVETTGNPHGRLALVPLAKELAERGERVYSWPEQCAPENATVTVYRVEAGK